MSRLNKVIVIKLAGQPVSLVGLSDLGSTCPAWLDLGWTGALVSLIALDIVLWILYRNSSEILDIERDILSVCIGRCSPDYYFKQMEAFWILSGKHISRVVRSCDNFRNCRWIFLKMRMCNEQSKWSSKQLLIMWLLIFFSDFWKNNAIHVMNISLLVSSFAEFIPSEIPSKISVMLKLFFSAVI